MNWKKNIFSYILWTVYLLGATCCFLSYGQQLVEGFGLNGSGGILAAGIGGILGIGVIFGILRLVRWKTADREWSFRIPWKMVEIFTVICLVFAGIVLRVLFLPDEAGTSDYMNVAQVTEGGRIPQITHGAVYLYLQLLHFFFRLFGNVWMVGIWLQIVLQITGSVLLYLGVRRIAGGFPATVLLAASMLLPDQIRAGMTYGPDMLYLCFYALGLLAASWYMRKAYDGAIEKLWQLFPLILVGAYLSFLTYLDIGGISLLILILSILNADRAENESQYGKMLVQIPVLLVSFLVSFVIWLAADALASQTLLPGVWNAWLGLYRIKGQDILFWMNEEEAVLHLAVNGLMILGAFGFWCRQEGERITPWVMMMISFSVMGFLRVPAERMNSLGLLLYVCIVAGAIGLMDTLGMDSPEMDAYGMEFPGSEEDHSEQKKAEEPESGAKRPQAGKENPSELEFVELAAADSEKADEERGRKSILRRREAFTGGKMAAKDGEEKDAEKHGSPLEEVPDESGDPKENKDLLEEDDLDGEDDLAEAEDDLDGDEDLMEENEDLDGDEDLMEEDEDLDGDDDLLEEDDLDGDDDLLEEEDDLDGEVDLTEDEDLDGEDLAEAEDDLDGEDDLTEEVDDLDGEDDLTEEEDHLDGEDLLDEDEDLDGEDLTEEDEDLDGEDLSGEEDADTDFAEGEFSDEAETAEEAEAGEEEAGDGKTSLGYDIEVDDNDDYDLL